MLRTLLDDAGGATVAHSLDEARSMLQAGDWDCLVLATGETIDDATIPAVLRHDGLVYRLPVVVVGDGPAWQAGKHALALGADDYVSRAELARTGWPPRSCCRSSAAAAARSSLPSATRSPGFPTGCCSWTGSAWRSRAGSATRRRSS